MTIDVSQPRSPGVAQPPRGAEVASGLRTAIPTLALIAVAITWGVSFSVVDGATAALSPADLVLWRFGIAGIVLCLLGRGAARLPTPLLIRAIVLGLLLGFGFLLQTWALTETDAMMSGFLIGTLVVMAPVLAWALFGTRPSTATWCGVATATAGLAVMSMRGGGFGRGEALTILAAAMWALHLVLLARWGRPGFAIGLARVQTLTVAVLALLSGVAAGLLTGSDTHPALPQDVPTWSAIAFLAVPATAVAMIAVSWAQPRMTAARAAVALTLEPAASAATAAMLGTAIDGRAILGGALLVGAMLLVELGGRLRIGRGLPATGIGRASRHRNRTVAQQDAPIGLRSGAWGQATLPSEGQPDRGRPGQSV